MQKFIFPLRNPDIIFQTVKMFRESTALNKVNLSIGIYADSKGKLPPTENQYIGIKGDQNLVKFTNNLLFNEVNSKILDKTHYIQSCGGTGALSLTSNILKLFSKHKTNIIIPDPSWPNHFNIFQTNDKITKIQYKKYKFYEDLIRTLEENNNIICNDSHNVLLMQTSCHNPTGIDFTQNQWENIFNLCEEKDITLIMDSAYIGMGKGISNDIKPVVSAFNKNIDVFVCVSYSKIASMYGHRLGLMYFKPKDSYENISDNFEYVSRITQSNPPRYGSDKLLAQYEKNPEKLIKEVEDMSIRIKETRQKLQDRLHNYDSFDFDKGYGMFCLLPYDSYQIDVLQQKYNIFVLPNSRINICGVTNHNFEYIVKAFKDVSSNYKPHYTI
jgi:aspartate/tyrosine/aromatic aminotransferase